MNNIERFNQYGLDYKLYKRGVYNGFVLIDLSICPGGFMDLYRIGIRKINGSMDCSFSRIDSFIGCPEVMRDLDCNHSAINSLEHCPSIGCNLFCSSTQLKSLEHCPSIGYNLYCRNNAITDIPEGFTHPLHKLVCDDIVKEGFNYRTRKALMEF